MRRACWQARLVAQLLWVVAVAAVLSTAADAHAVLLASSPKDNSVLTTAPKTVMLRFDARIEKSVTQVKLTDSKGHRVKLPSGRGYKAGSPERLIIPMPPLKPGRYRLEYRILAADGHLTPGLVRFTILTRKAP